MWPLVSQVWKKQRRQPVWQWEKKKEMKDRTQGGNKTRKERGRARASERGSGRERWLRRLPASPPFQHVFFFFALLVLPRPPPPPPTPLFSQEALLLGTKRNQPAQPSATRLSQRWGNAVAHWSSSRAARPMGACRWGRRHSNLFFNPVVQVREPHRTRWLQRRGDGGGEVCSDGRERCTIFKF